MVRLLKSHLVKKITHGLLVQLMPSTHLNKSQLKIIEILPSPFCLTDKQIQLSQWMARYYHDDVYVYQAMMPKWIKQAKLQPYVPQDKYAIKKTLIEESYLKYNKPVLTGCMGVKLTSSHMKL